jgi:protein-S-isoprenylcysteine O-methyltransferase Ste14
MSCSAQDWGLRKLSSYRGFAYIPPFSLMAITFYKEWEDDFIVWPLGIMIILIGALIRLWGTKHIGRRMPWMKKKGKKLIQTGHYALVRNPLYIGNIIIATGLSILSELIWIVPLIIIYLLFLYHLVALYEEKKLLERWGKEYSGYLNEVPRWIPNLKGLNLAKSGGVKWWDAMRSEIPSGYVCLFAIFIFMMKECLSHMVDIW